MGKLNTDRVFSKNLDEGQFLAKSKSKYNNWKIDKI